MLRPPALARPGAASAKRRGTVLGGRRQMDALDGMWERWTLAAHFAAPALAPGPDQSVRRLASPEPLPGVVGRVPSGAQEPGRAGRMDQLRHRVEHAAST